MEPLWVDKHRPRTLDKLSYHPDVTEALESMAATSDFPHIIFYGPEGAGKKTRAYAFLEKLFGPSVYKLHNEEKVLKPEGTSTTIEYTMLTSNNHIEITPSDNDHNDRHIIQNVVKEIAQTKTVEKKKNKNFKVLIINEADRLTKDAQGGLRRTMQKYMKNCRMVLICANVHKLIPPIRSRCLNVRIPAPSEDEITEVLWEIGEKESKGFGNHSFTAETMKNISKFCERNLRMAIIQLQLSKHMKNTDSLLVPYKREIKEIASMIVKEQTAAQLKKIRDKFYDLLVNCIEGGIILKEVLFCLLESEGISQTTSKELIHQAAKYEQTLMCGSKAIYHLQAFAAHAMEQIMNSASQ